MLGCARLREFEQGVELVWNTRKCVSLEAKELGEQVTNGFEMNFGKWINIKSR